MPALSPTMTEGNIAAWRVKEGDKFAAGDVILEIETDKATMDVEGQEDGILMKIMQGDGSKGVQVGSRIAVLAEEGDDISQLELPADESPKQQQQQVEKQSASEQGQRPVESDNKPAASRTESTQAGASESQSSPTRPSGKPQKQKYPLLPSVAHLMKEHGIDESKVGEMTPTGPNGRLLKGDVLAYMGSIKAETPAKVTAYFDRLQHLDLSNIKVAKTKKPEKKAEEAPQVPEELTVTVPISLAAVFALQKKIEENLGSLVPLSTFIARATVMANDDLPRPASYQATADELFNQVLGLDKVGPRGSQGSYLPQISALPPASLTAQRPGITRQQPDIIDILAGKAKPAPQQRRPAAQPGLSTGTNMFSLAVPKEEEKRATVFLERVKAFLEKEPGRLVL